jgi:hypothetical protein
MRTLIHRISAITIIACALSTGLASAAGIADVPKRKAGLWQQTIAGQGMPTQTMSMCTDEKTDDLLQSKARGSSQCTQQSVRREGSSVVVDAACKEGKTTIRTHGVFSGDFSSRYSGEMRSTFDPPMHGMKEMSQKIEARWLGACKPGQKPGDVTLDSMGGTPMNMNQMLNADPRQMQEMMQQMQKMQEQMQQQRAR